MNRCNNLIKTAHFAKLCNVSKQTLIYYDNKEIFHPCYIDKKGYRYYSLRQYEAFMVILMLRNVGTPLSEIRKYLKNKSTYSFLQLLSQKQKEVNKRIRELNELSKMIEERKKTTQYGMSIQNAEKIYIQHMNEERIIISNNIKSDDETEHVKAMSSLEKYMSENNTKSFNIGGIVEKNKLLTKQDYNVTYYYIKTNTICKNTELKPRGLYATTYHKGYYDTTYLTYTRLIEYIKLNNYVIIGNAYEDVLLDSCTQKNEKDFLTRISILLENFGL